MIPSTVAVPMNVDLILSALDLRIPTHFGQRSDFDRTVIRFNSDTRPI
jgi:hypothetical protein